MECKRCTQLGEPCRDHRQPQATEIVTPIIHMNGDCKQTLLNNLEAAYTAVGAAMDALMECSPNGRNFYPEPGRLQKAEAQHRERWDHLQAVRASLEAEAIAIDKENPGRGE